MQCENLPNDFDNKTTSLKVYRTKILGAAGGTWRSITASKGIDFKVKYGYQYDTSRETSKSMEY